MPFEDVQHSLTAAGVLGLLLLASPSDAQSVGAASKERAGAEDTKIRPFSFRASDEELAELRRRIAETRWPEKETVTDHSQGVPLATMRELARYWATDYDWRKAEAK